MTNSRMANFNTHLSVATSASATLAIAATAVHIVPLSDLLECIFLGAIGGLLPDIDANQSKPAKLLFKALGLMIAFSLAWFYRNHYPIALLLLMGSLTFVIVRYGVLRVFNHLTVHRGVFHSLLATAFFALLTSCISYYFLHCSALKSWISALFIAFGFIVHLLLDECYSVDLSNKRIKKSFGSALKLWSYKNLNASLMMAIPTLGLYALSPPMGHLLALYHNTPWRIYLPSDKLDWNWESLLSIF